MSKTEYLLQGFLHSSSVTTAIIMVSVLAFLTAAGIAPTKQLESGMAATLPPGLYTALLVGINNGAGIGLVEVYDFEAP
jgi:hypothetical protein